MKFDSPEAFAITIGKIKEELLCAHLHYCLYGYLAEVKKSYEREFFRSWGFWGITLDGFLSLVVLGLCRIYDENSNANSLHNLLLTIRADQSNSGKPHYLSPIASANLAKLDGDIDWFTMENPLVSRLQKWRHNVLAHSSWKYLGQGKPVPASMIPLHEDIEPLIIRALEIVSRYSDSCVSHGVNEVYAEPQRKEIEFIFQSIREKTTTTEAEIRAWFKDRGVNPDVFFDKEKQFDAIFRKNNLL